MNMDMDMDMDKKVKCTDNHEHMPAGPTGESIVYCRDLSAISGIYEYITCAGFYFADQVK